MGAFAVQGAPIRRLTWSRILWAPIHRYATGSTLLEELPALVSKRRGGHNPAHEISTLNPKFLKPADVLDLSHKNTLTVAFPHHNSGPGLLVYRQSDEDGYLPFPDHSRGFLYYRSEPSAEPLEGSLRFRLTPDDSPSSFPRGQDLLGPWGGLPWQIALPQIACYDKYRRIQDQLLHENLATEEQLAHCRAIFRNHTRCIFPQYTLFRLESPFLVNFSAIIHLTAVGSALHKLHLSPLTDWAGSKVYRPWSGSAVARFEASMRPEYAGRRVVHMRIVKIIQPVAPTEAVYTGRVPKPEEGQLLNVAKRGRAPEPWAYDVDEKGSTAAGLRVLWDNSAARQTRTQS
ncbi:hypothetical protein C8R44DRAFT_261603 [Mycena epipterygia]|nr:hypothetical protein C8R44DRAFT_261603 [Mycena epipterygia]